MNTIIKFATKYGITIGVGVASFVVGAIVEHTVHPVGKIVEKSKPVECEEPTEE